jgi:hypothetical protein
MQTKYIVALSVVVLILLGYIGYRHYKQEAEYEADQKKTDSIMLAMARTSAAGGMTQMAMALKKYELGNGAYPGTLQELYPEYMRSKPFIEDIAWEYEPRGHDFLLKKRFTRNAKQMVASVDKSLRTRIHTSFMVASAGDVSKTEISKLPDKSETSQPATSEKAQATTPMERRLQALVQKPLPTEWKRVSEEEKRYIGQPIPEPFTVVDAETCKGFPVEASGQHLVWKDRLGVLGFGNVDYPDAGKLTICANGQWVRVKRAPQETREPEKSADAARRPRRTFFGVEIR